MAIFEYLHQIAIRYKSGISKENAYRSDLENLIDILDFNEKTPFIIHF
jgi:hypothetical protein